METKKLLFHVKNNFSCPYSEVGTKAHTLNNISSIVNVPRYWTISEDFFESFLLKCGIESIATFFINDFSLKYKQLINQCDFIIEGDYTFPINKKYIVRSSIVPYERTIDFASEISGAFESIVCDGNNISNAILQVFESVFSEKAYNQVRLFSLENNIKGMAVVIQEYISPIYSGVIHVTNENSIHLQWIEGHLSEIVNGNEFGHSNYIYKNSNNEAIFRGSEKEIAYIRDNHIVNIFSDILALSSNIFIFLKKPQEIEWIFDGKNHWIVQCQELIE